MKHAKHPARMLHSTQVGEYMPLSRGSLGLERLGTTITKRSSHMPTVTKRLATTVPLTVLVFRLHRIINGTTKQHTNIPQNSGQNFPVTFEFQIIMWLGSAP